MSANKSSCCETSAASLPPSAKKGWLSAAFSSIAPPILAHAGCAVSILSPTVGAMFGSGLSFGFSAAAAVGFGCWSWFRGARRMAVIGTITGLAASAYINFGRNEAKDLDAMPADCPMHRQMKPQN